MFNCKEKDFELPSLNGDSQVTKKQQNIMEYLSTISSTTGIILLKQLRKQNEIVQ